MMPVVAKYRIFQDAEAATREFYLRLTPEEGLEILFQLRAMAHEENDAASQRVARVCRIVELPRR